MVQFISLSDPQWLSSLVFLANTSHSLGRLTFTASSSNWLVFYFYVHFWFYQKLKTTASRKLLCFWQQGEKQKQQTTTKKSQTAHMWSSLLVKWLLSFPSLTVPAVHILAFAKLQVTTFQWPFLCVLNSWNSKLYIYQCQKASIYFPLHMWIFFEKFKVVNL